MKILNIVTPYVTSDQPLRLKTVEITKSKLLNVVCRLGFHLLISFLGSVGKVMECSGISELSQVVYSSATAVCMFSGKTYGENVCKNTTSPFPCAICSGTYYTPIHFTFKFNWTAINIRCRQNIYLMLVIQMMNSFQMKYLVKTL